MPRCGEQANGWVVGGEGGCRVCRCVCVSAYRCDRLRQAVQAAGRRSAGSSSARSAACCPPTTTALHRPHPPPRMHLQVHLARVDFEDVEARALVRVGELDLAVDSACKQQRVGWVGGGCERDQARGDANSILRSMRPARRAPSHQETRSGRLLQWLLQLLPRPRSARQASAALLQASPPPQPATRALTRAQQRGVQDVDAVGGHQHLRRYFGWRWRWRRVRGGTLHAGCVQQALAGQLGRQAGGLASRQGGSEPGRAGEAGREGGRQGGRQAVNWAAGQLAGRLHPP